MLKIFKCLKCLIEYTYKRRLGEIILFNIKILIQYLIEKSDAISNHAQFRNIVAKFVNLTKT